MKRVLTFLTFILLSSFISTVASAQNVATSTEDDINTGRRIYLEGILPSGAELTGTRFGNTLVSGSAAACVNCHRRSGMGQVEGDIQVQPITGNFLFATAKDKQFATMDPRVSKRFNQAHEPYSDATLAKAVTRGINSQNIEMNQAMPRYNLSEPEMKALTAYLKQLSSKWSPGVTGSNIRFAMVITPDVDPLRRKTLIDMMTLAVRQKNGSTEVAKQGAGGRHHMVSAAEFVLGTERNWTLDVWELQGAPETWGEQLESHYRSQPVFALISGLSNSTWQPVHDFCEHDQVPCWFPSVDLPVNSTSQYSFYFSGGVTLEADVLARHLLDQPIQPRRVLQIYRDDDAGRAASLEFSHALAGSKISVENRMLPIALTAEIALQQSLSKVKHNDVVMFWLRPDDLSALNKIKPVAGMNYFSTILAKADHLNISPAWKAHARLVYPYELPEKREANLAYFHAWLNLRKLPVVDEAMQSEAFFALNFLTDTIAEMLDNIYRDYLVERAEVMLSKREGIKSEQETRDRVYLGKPGELERKHGPLTADESVRIHFLADQQNHPGKSQGTTIYPHLSLGPGQRFASKGGYIVRFADGTSDKLIAESDWIIP